MLTERLYVITDSKNRIKRLVNKYIDDIPYIELLESELCVCSRCNQELLPGSVCTVDGDLDGNYCEDCADSLRRQLENDKEYDPSRDTSYDAV